MDIQKLIKDFAALRKLSGTILVAIDDAPVCFEHFGFADQSTHSYCAPNTQFLIAFITKQFTAVAVLRALYEKALVSAENLDLIVQKVQEDIHRPIGYFMREDHGIWAGRMPTWANKVTTHQLLTHSSGLPNWTSLPEFSACRDNPPEVSGMVGLFKDKDLEFDPGSQFAYCNSGYLLLGELVHQVTGKSLGEYMEKTFFEPLDMASTVYPTQGTVPDLKKSDPRFQNLARGYSFPVCVLQPSLSEVKGSVIKSV